MDIDGFRLLDKNYSHFVCVFRRVLVLSLIFALPHSLSGMMLLSKNSIKTFSIVEVSLDPNK